MLSQLESGVGEGCRTCTFCQQAVRCFTADPDARVLFQEDPKRFRIGRKFYEVFKMKGKSFSKYTALKGGRG